MSGVTYILGFGSCIIEDMIKECAQYTTKSCWRRARDGHGKKGDWHGRGLGLTVWGERGSRAGPEGLRGTAKCRQGTVKTRKYTGTTERTDERTREHVSECQAE